MICLNNFFCVSFCLFFTVGEAIIDDCQECCPVKPRITEKKDTDNTEKNRQDKTRNISIQNNHVEELLKLKKPKSFKRNEENDNACYKNQHLKPLDTYEPVELIWSCLIKQYSVTLRILFQYDLMFDLLNCFL